MYWWATKGNHGARRFMPRVLVCLLCSALVAATSCSASDENWQSWAAKDAPSWDPIKADASGLCATLERAYGARADFRYEVERSAEAGSASAQALSRLEAARSDALDVVAHAPFVRARSVWSLTEVEAALFGRVFGPPSSTGPDLVQFEHDRMDTDHFAQSRCQLAPALVEVASAADFLAGLAQNQPVTVALPSNR